MSRAMFNQYLETALWSSTTDDGTARWHVTVTLDGTLPLTEINGRVIFLIAFAGSAPVSDYSRWEIEIVGDSEFGKLIKPV